MILTAQQAADMLQLHVVTVRDMAKRGVLPARKCGRDWRFSERALLAWLEEGSECHSTSEMESFGSTYGPVLKVAGDEYADLLGLGTERKPKRSTTTSSPRHSARASSGNVRAIRGGKPSSRT